MNKVISIATHGSGFSPVAARRSRGNRTTWIAGGIAAFLPVAAASVLWAIAWLLALSD